MQGKNDLNLDLTDELFEDMRHSLHALLAVSRQATECEEPVRQTSDHLQPGPDPGVGEVSSELNILIQTRVYICAEEQGGGEVGQQGAGGQQRGDQDIILTCAKHQLILQAPGEGGEVAGVLVGVDALAEDTHHEQGVHQHQQSRGRGVDLGQQTGVTQMKTRGHTDPVLDALNTIHL